HWRLVGGLLRRAACVADGSVSYPITHDRHVPGLQHRRDDLWRIRAIHHRLADIDQRQQAGSELLCHFRGRNQPDLADLRPQKIRPALKTIGIVMTTSEETLPVPDLAAITDLHGQLQRWIRTTPVVAKSDFDPVAGTDVFFKFELLQASGTFKARGAFSNLLALDEAQRNAGVTCVSA